MSVIDSLLEARRNVVVDAEHVVRVVLLLDNVLVAECSGTLPVRQTPESSERRRCGSQKRQNPLLLRHSSLILSHWSRRFLKAGKSRLVCCVGHLG
jgi:hypothetical protein